MIPVLSVANMRKSDADTIAKRTPSKELMFRAGEGVFSALPTWVGPVGIVCGSGNNAGDGYVLALLLRRKGIACELLLCSDRFSEDGRYYFEQCQEEGIPFLSIQAKPDLSRYKTLVDCLFGTGFKGQAEGLAKDVIEAINASSAYVVSVDINSGLNGDSGLSACCVHSSLTVSIGSYKSGHYLSMAKDVMKSKVNCDIGIEPIERPYFLLEEKDILPLFRPRKNYSNKGSYGYVALLGGSKKYTGAIRLAAMANAAMRCGAGVVKLASPSLLCPQIAPDVLESTLFPLSDDGEEVLFKEGEIASLIGNVKTVSFGMGVGTSPGAQAILEYLLSHFAGRLIVDADGLTLLSRLEKEKILSCKGHLVLTPHIKEFSRLTGRSIEEILENPISYAENYAKECHVVLLLKGPTTIVTNGETTYLVDKGCAGMATAGSGDVLSGILSAVLATSDDLLLATAAGAYLNGLAGEKAQARYGSIAMIASDTVASLRDAVGELEKKNID